MRNFSVKFKEPDSVSTTTVSMQSRNPNTKQSSKNPLYDTSNYNSKDLFLEDGRGWERSFFTKKKKGPQLVGAAPSLWFFIGIGRLALAAERLNLLEEVVALVIY